MENTEKFNRQRKFMVMLPLLITPFITMLFWSMGGGQAAPVKAAANENIGLNMAVPDAYFDPSEVLNKFNLYEKAYEDSMKVEDAVESESYFNVELLKDGKDDSDTSIKAVHARMSPAENEASIDPNEEKVNEKLNELYKVLNQTAAPKPQPDQVKATPVSEDSAFSDDVVKLEQMMQSMQHSDTEDPEMKQISSMLDKIIEVQHPERSKPAEGDVSERAAYSVEPFEDESEISLISNSVIPPAVENTDSAFVSDQDPAEVLVQNHFFGDEDETGIKDEQENSFNAVIHQNQEVVAGSTVKLRLVNGVTINGKHIPEGRFIYGTCSLNEERLSITITSIRNANSLLPVAMQVYDLDGLPGIYIPGAITRDAAKQASGQSLQGMQLYSMDNSLGMQAASAGVEGAKGLMTKKAKLIKVNLKAGYQLLLRDTNSNNSLTASLSQR